jgi:hypothetical protein
MLRVFVFCFFLAKKGVCGENQTFETEKVYANGKDVICNLFAVRYQAYKIVKPVFAGELHIHIVQVTNIVRLPYSL